MVNHTVDRILLDLGIIEQVKELKAKYGNVQLQFIHKLGMDGSKGHPGGHHVLGILESCDSTNMKILISCKITFLSLK